MDWLTAVWDWLKNPDNRTVLAFIGGSRELPVSVLDSHKNYG